jgi:hypothetical protein
MSGHLEGKVALVTGGGRGSSLTSRDRMPDYMTDQSGLIDGGLVFR